VPVVFAAFALASPEAPSEFIAETAGALATAVAARRVELDTDRLAREALIDELLLPKFDLETACRLILGEHWRAAEVPERRRFVAAFYRHLLASYGDALPRFGPQTITVLAGQDDVPGTSTRVRTRLRMTDGKSFEVDFYLRRDQRGWRIVDVIAEGISYLRTYRSDFGAEVRSEGLEALILRLEGAVE
jgi:phospholipid transport system substrate-binding protein